jgi:hypothetical protein
MRWAEGTSVGALQRCMCASCVDPGTSEDLTHRHKTVSLFLLLTFHCLTCRCSTYRSVNSASARAAAPSATVVNEWSQDAGDDDAEAVTTADRRRKKSFEVDPLALCISRTCRCDLPFFLPY